MNKTNPYNYHTLSNGIRLIHRHTDSEVAHLGASIDVGSRDEKNADNGMAHFIEHCIFKGTSNRSSSRILSRIDGVGGELNAYTTKEETVVYATFLKTYYPRAIELLSDIVFNSIFPEKELEKEKSVIIEEINSYEDSPADLIFDDFERLVFGNTGLGRMILGTPQKVNKFTSSQVRNYVSDKWSPNLMVISTVGNIDFEKWSRLCEKYFSPYPSRQAKRRRSVKYHYQVRNICQQKDTCQAHIMLGNQAYSYKDDNKIAFSLLNNIIGSPAMNSVLNMHIRERYGFCYTIESSYQAYSDNGIFQIYTGTEEKHINDIIALIFKELNVFANKRLTQSQLYKAKQQLKGQLSIQYDNNQNEMLSIGKTLLNFNKVETLQDTFNHIDNVTAEDILKVAKDIFQQDQFSSIIYL